MTATNGELFIVLPIGRANENRHKNEDLTQRERLKVGSVNNYAEQSRI